MFEIDAAVLAILPLCPAEGVPDDLLLAMVGGVLRAGRLTVRSTAVVRSARHAGLDAWLDSLDIPGAMLGSYGTSAAQCRPV